MLFPLARTYAGRGNNGLVVRFAAAGGKCDLLEAASETRGHRLPCGEQRFRRFLPDGVEAGGIAVEVLKTGQHGPNRRITHPGGGGVIHIDGHFNALLKKVLHISLVCL